MKEFNHKSLEIAIEEIMIDYDKAIKKYGPISSWKFNNIEDLDDVKNIRHFLFEFFIHKHKVQKAFTNSMSIYDITEYSLVNANNLEKNDFRIVWDLDNFEGGIYDHNGSIIHKNIIDIIENNTYEVKGIFRDHYDQCFYQYKKGLYPELESLPIINIDVDVFAELMTDGGYDRDGDFDELRPVFTGWDIYSIYYVNDLDYMFERIIANRLDLFEEKKILGEVLFGENWKEVENHWNIYHVFRDYLDLPWGINKIYSSLGEEISSVISDATKYERAELLSFELIFKTKK
jgi:hypothetical protein